MEIFGVGGFEIALVIVIALIVAGPARMAVWMRTLGQWVAKMRQMWSVTAAQLQRELDDAGVDFRVPTDIPSRKAFVDELNRSSTIRELTKPIEEVQTALVEARSEMTAAGNSITRAAHTPAGVAKVAVSDEVAAPAGFGTWGGAKSTPASADTTDFGTWGAPVEPTEPKE